MGKGSGADLLSRVVPPESCVNAPPPPIGGYFFERLLALGRGHAGIRRVGLSFDRHIPERRPRRHGVAPLCTQVTAPLTGREAARNRVLRLAQPASSLEEREPRPPSRPGLLSSVRPDDSGLMMAGSPRDRIVRTQDQFEPAVRVHANLNREARPQLDSGPDSSDHPDDRICRAFFGSNGVFPPWPFSCFP